MQKNDIVIIGAGIAGTSISRALSELGYGVKVMEKEPYLSQHQTSRSSGVAHSGYNYTHGSIKAELSRVGNRRIVEYCEVNHLPINKSGKIIVARDERDISHLMELVENARLNGVEVRLLDMNDQKDRDFLKEKEPYAKTYRYALWSPSTAVVDPIKIASSFAEEAKSNGAEFMFGTEMTGVNAEKSVIYTDKGKEIGYDYLINCAGLHADEIAHMFGLAPQYEVVPFRGDYSVLSDDKSYLVNGNIYRVPDKGNPWTLGVHLTRTVDGKVIVGPTATPVLGRENYAGLNDLHVPESMRIFSRDIELLISDRAFRELAWEELHGMRKKYHASQVAKILDTVSVNDLIKADFEKEYDGGFGLPTEIKHERSGIRAQIYDRTKKQLVKDFLIIEDRNSLHILNAVSPLITCSLPFGEHIAAYIDDEKEPFWRQPAIGRHF